MTEKKIITVFGATGAQGGGLARAILNDPNGGFAVRAITRDIKSEKARALAALGAEVVDDNRRPLTANGRKSIAATILGIEQTMDAREIVAGSAAALRLYS